MKKTEEKNEGRSHVPRLPYDMRHDLPTVDADALIPEMEHLFGRSLKGFEILYENDAKGGLDSIFQMCVDEDRKLIVFY